MNRGSKRHLVWSSIQFYTLQMSSWKLRQHDKVLSLTVIDLTSKRKHEREDMPKYSFLQKS